MISDLERQFIEGAGRALTERCRHCRQDVQAAECVRPYANGVTLHEPVVAFRDHELAGARLWGMLEQANGYGLAEIVKSAARADAPASMTAIRGVGNGRCERYGCNQDAGNLYRVGSEIGLLCRAHADARQTQLFDLGKFASAIALEWVGAGVSRFDTHERFAVAHDHCARCGCARFHRTVTPKGCEKCGCQYPTFSRPFAVPQLRTEATP